MALYRPTPKCPHCGKDTATAKYKDQSSIPEMFRIIGDTFEGWIHKECRCKGARKYRKEQRKKNKGFWSDVLKSIKEKNGPKS